MVNERTNYAKDIIALLHEAYGGRLKIFENSIPLSVRAAEISAEGKSIYALTRELRKMVGWLKVENCQIVAMESTGSFWKPLYNIFELEGMEAIIVNPQHMKAIPGRKTDVNDAQW